MDPGEYLANLSKASSGCGGTFEGSSTHLSSLRCDIRGPHESESHCLPACTVSPPPRIEGSALRTCAPAHLCSACAMSMFRKIDGGPDEATSKVEPVSSHLGTLGLQPESER